MEDFAEKWMKWIEIVKFPFNIAIKKNYFSKC